MKLIHAFWQPEATKKFIQRGQFFIWIESDEVKSIHSRKLSAKINPFQLSEKSAPEFLKINFNYPLDLSRYKTESQIKAVPHSIYLPSIDNKPLLSAEFPEGDFSVTEPSEQVDLIPWQVAAYPIHYPIKELANIYFISHVQIQDTQISRDFLFWHYFSQSLKEIISKDRYLPCLLTEKNKTRYTIYPYWEIISPDYEALIENAIQFMPLACSQGFQAETLLRHFAEVTINNLLHTSVQQLPQIFSKKIAHSFVEPIILSSDNAQALLSSSKIPEPYQQWFQWQQKLLPNKKDKKNCDKPLQLGFQLIEATSQHNANWHLSFILCSHQDPAFKISLADYWQAQKSFENLIQEQFGDNLLQQILVNLSQAARIYALIWQGMETSQPTQLSLDLHQAYEFLSAYALVLEDAGYRIIIPAHLTPKGRQRVKMRLRSQNKSSSTSSSSQTSNKSYLSLDSLTNYHYEFSIGDQHVSLEEWQQLLAMKMPLVQFRGQWVELDHEKMQEMLHIWQQHDQQLSESLSVPDLIKKLAQEGEMLALDEQDEFSQLLEKLKDSSRFELMENPPQLRAQLRDYQKRGVSWLFYLESLGLNGCLADDMGLGKTMQVIALLLLQNSSTNNLPTLLIAPTSVLGNWEKEIQCFAPSLKTFIYHGSDREKEPKAFKKLCANVDMIISSYTMIRTESLLFNHINWHRIVLDEAQNIKNPKSAQTKAVLKLTADHRLALTGTPVENRLMDLWSIFSFLLPNYLGKQAQFRKSYELPIQRDNDLVQSGILKQLIQPLVLRRLKTDKNIIKDLPDKVEHKQYCHLSKEQAALYQTVVKDVDKQLEQAEGIARQGLMLSTLMKLKQICNHPAQFLQDNSTFSVERSHKLERLSEMLVEAVAEGDSVLIFTQFTEIGEKLKTYLSQSLSSLASDQYHYPCYYLHGGVARKKREQMISDFQNPNMPPAIFVLSLKAGGVGITLTRANHVFHFDRWWNPAVENQATDRAFRIGQKKNVFVHKFITLGTLEERIDEMIEEKKKMTDNIIGSDESWLTKLDNQAFTSLIALKQTNITDN